MSTVPSDLSRAAEGSTALAANRESRAPWHSLDWQQLWLATQIREWRCLALVPGGDGGPTDFTVTVAEKLARIGMMHLGIPVRAVDGTNVPLSRMVNFTARIEKNIRLGDIVLLALAPTDNNPVAVALAQTADAAVLCVMLQTMKVATATQTIETVGRTRFIGSVLVDRDTPEPAAARASKSARRK